MPKKPKRRTAKPSPKPGIRISIEDALHVLLDAYRPHEGTERINAALRANSMRLWCNGNVVPPDFICTHLVVQAVHESDGRPRAKIVPIRSLDDKPDAYAFEVDEAEVMALLPPPRRPPGPRPRGDWPILIRRELSRMGRKRVQQLQNSGELRDHLEALLRRKLGWFPKDPKALN